MKRRLLTIAIFLLAGAVVNVAVAWGCARWPRYIFSISSENSVALSFQDIAWWNKHVSPLFHRHAEFAFKRREVGIEASMFFSAATAQGHMSAIHIVSGWPARSLSGEFWDSYAQGKPPQWSERRAVIVDLNRSFAVPLRPLWPGFTVNSLFYAGILWLLLPGPFTLRRLIRSRRGLCPACAYDLCHAEHEACPECGVTA